MDFEKYTDRARGFVQSAQSLALREGHQQFAPEHLLKVLLDDPEGLAAGLIDRGILAEGYRADIVLVDDEVPMRPRSVAVIAAGRLVHLTDANRLIRSSHAQRKAVAVA